MKKSAILISFLALTLLNIFFASWYVLHNDINFSADIARDFLLFEELDEKKIVLIGPRSSVPGVYHGPLWLYLTYPGFVAGNGNPVAVGWYWIFLTLCFLMSCYYIAKRLFDEQAALLFVLMTSLYMLYHANGLYNPHGVFFFLPAFFYFFIRYLQTWQIRFLLIHLFIAGLLIQFQMAIGAPFLVLSLAYMTIATFRKRKLNHLLAVLILFFPLASFVLFDLRHDMQISRSLLEHFQRGNSTANYVLLLGDRIRVMVTGTEFLRYGPSNGSFYVFLTFALFLFLQIKNNRHRTIYLIFLYFYIGFFFLSLFNKFLLLYFYVFPLFPLAFLIFSSFVTSKYKKAFLVIFFVIYAINFTGAIQYLKTSANSIGKSQDSWKFLYTVASRVYEGPEKEFGYFVYSPDVLGYGPKYAMSYGNKVSGKNAQSFQKKPLTYLVIAPPPRNNPYMEDAWWKENQINVKKNPEKIVQFENGFKIEKYTLTNEEMNVPFDPSINPGIHFR